MKILRDITIESYLKFINSDNKTFRKYYSEGLDLDSEEYQKLFNEAELLMDMVGVDEESCPDLVQDSNSKDDFENSKKIFNWLNELSASDANDPRLWTTLTHVKFENYVKKRWAIDKKTTNKTIKNRYFYVGASMQARLRNALSRLWWIPRLTVREDLPDKYLYTKIVWSSQDVMQNLFERTLGTYPSVRFAILRFYSERKKRYSEKEFRVFFKEINALGAIKPLGLLSEDEVYKYILDIEKTYFLTAPILRSSEVNEPILEIENKKSFVKRELYIKRIVQQDLERTPSIGVNAAEKFFNINLKNGETCFINCSYGLSKFNIKMNKRKTRNEYRFFINRIKNVIDFNVNDLILFSKKEKIFEIELLTSGNQKEDGGIYQKYKSILNKKTHVLHSEQ